MRLWLEILLTGLSSAFLILIFPDYDYHYLAWAALVPLLLLIKRGGPLKAFLYPLAVGLVFFSGHFWWGGVDGFNALNFGLVVLLSGVYLGLFGISAHCLDRINPRWNVLTFPAAWVLTEYLRSHMGFLSNPSGLLGYTQYTALTVAQVSAFTGVYGVSFLIVTVNTAAAEIIHSVITLRAVRGSREMLSLQEWRAPLVVIAVTAVLFSSSIVYGLVSSVDRQPVRSLKAALVQGNVYWEENNDIRYRTDIFEKYRRLSMDAAAFTPDIIAWPSSSVPGKIPYDRTLVKLLSGLARETGAFLLIGSAGYDKFKPAQRKSRRFANSAFLFSPQGGILGRYDKIRLLPFDEYLPLRGWVKWPSWIVSDMKDALRGEEMTIFNMAKGRFGVVICWEALFPEQFREITAKGVDFMVSMTNEGFTDTTRAHYQMFAINVFRAIENNVSIIRTASTGVSAIIGPDGGIISRVKDSNNKDVDVAGYVVGEIPLSSKRTFYNRYGDWFIIANLILLIGFVSSKFYGKKRAFGDGND